MARIKITDIPKDAKISKEELKRVKGGIGLTYPSTYYTSFKVEDSTYLKMVQDISSFLK